MLFPSDACPHYHQEVTALSVPDVTQTWKCIDCGLIQVKPGFTKEDVKRVFPEDDI